MNTNIKPTRSELLQLKNRIKTAKQGYSLLKKKRDGLILDFMQMLKKVKKGRAIVDQAYQRAENSIKYARMIESDKLISILASGMASPPPLTIENKSVTGVKVPVVGDITLQKTADSRHLSIYTSSSIQQSAKSFETLVEFIVKISTTEIALRRMLKEIEKTKRRVNALEFNVIPHLQKTRAFIQLRLEEAERENIFRMKRIKKKAAKSAKQNRA